MGVMPGRSSAKARGWGSLCLHCGQRLRPIFAGFQVLIRKGGMQKGPSRHSSAPLFDFLAVFWSTTGLGPSLLQTEYVKASKSRCPQAKTGCIVVEPAYATHITRRWREPRSPGNPSQSLLHQNGVAYNSVNSRTINLGPCWLRDQKGFRLPSWT